MDIDLLVKVTARAWALDILSLIHDGVPARQAPLLQRTTAGRTAFAQSLAHLVALGLLERNPGHGHPLRPEFRLTETGARVAGLARTVTSATQDDGERAILRRVWTLPVLAVAAAPVRFGDIKRDLDGITDRALSQTLQRLEERHWLKRDIDPADRPIRPLYRAANTGRLIAEAVRAA